MVCEKADQRPDDVENLYSESVCRPDELLYEGSDDEYYESAEIRKARLAAAARRFLDGDNSFILSSALKGPFEGSAGWANPWRSKRSKVTPQVEAHATPTGNKNRRRSGPSQTHNFETQANTSLECHLLSPESLTQGPLAAHNFMEEDEVARVQNWRTTVHSVGTENDDFWAGHGIKSTSPQTRASTRKRAQGSDWLKGTNKRSKPNEANDAAPLRRSRRTQSSPVLSNRPSTGASLAARPSHASQSSVLRRRSLKAQPGSDAEDELTSSMNVPLTNSTRRRSSPLKRVSPRSALKSSQGSASYSEDELAHEDEADVRAAATLSSPVSNKGRTRDQKLGEGGKYTSSPQRSKGLSSSPKQGGKFRHEDLMDQESDASPEMEPQRGDGGCFNEPTNVPEQIDNHSSSSRSGTDSSDAETLSSSASDDEGTSKVLQDAEDPTGNVIQPEIIDDTQDFDMASDLSTSDSSDVQMDDVLQIKPTPTTIDTATKAVQSHPQDDEDLMDNSGSEESDSGDAEPEDAELSNISSSQTQEIPVAIQNETLTTIQPRPKTSEDVSITPATINPPEQLINISEGNIEYASSSAKQAMEEEESLSTETSDSDESSQPDNSGEGSAHETPVSQPAGPCIEEDNNIHVPTTPSTEQTAFIQNSGQIGGGIDGSETRTPDDQVNKSTPQSPWAKSQYSQFLVAAASGSPMGDLEKVDREPAASCQSSWPASQDPFQQPPELGEVKSGSDLAPSTSATESQGGRQSTPECQDPFQPFSAFMTPSPERIARRKARAVPRLSSGGLPGSQILASAMKNPWSGGKANRRVSWAPLPHETPTEVGSASSEDGQLSPSQRQRPSSPPPRVSVEDVPNEAGEDRFRDHFDAVARRAAEHPEHILPTESQQTVGSPDACAMADNFIAFDENKTVDSYLYPQKRDSATPRSQDVFTTEMDNDDLLEDVFNDIQELLQPYNLDVELEQARKESGNDPVPVDIWAL